MSDYHIATTDKPDDLANVLARALGEKGRKKFQSVCLFFFFYGFLIIVHFWIQACLKGIRYNKQQCLKIKVKN